MLEKIKTIIVEDELYDRKLIEKILTENYSDSIDIVDITDNAEDAISSIKTKNPQLVFLDIELNGDRDGAFNILKQVERNNFNVVFVTAKNQRDDFLKAIRLSCMDYLIKPTKISDFAPPIQKTLEEIHNSGITKERIEILKHNVSIKDKQESKISLQEGYSSIPTYIKEIVWCEAQGNYTKVYFNNDKSLLTNGNLKSYEDKLGLFGFCRINKSELINLTHISAFSKKNHAWEVKMSTKKVLYISNQRKQNFLIQYNELYV